jgi:O-antigen/teichoic acid export membrane protein
MYSNYLNAQQLGMYFWLVTASYFGNALIFAPLDYYQQANLKRIIEKSGGIKPFIRVGAIIVLAYVGMVIIISSICMIIIGKYATAVLIAGLLSVLLYLNQSARNILNNLGRKNDVLNSLLLEAIVRIIVYFGIIKFISSSEIVTVAAWVLALCVSLAALAYRFYFHRLLNESNKISINLQDVFYFSYPISIGSMCNWIQLQGYRLILVPLGFTEVVGVFATISGVGSAGMSAVSTIFSQLYSPNIYKTFGAYTKTYLKYSGVLILCIFIGSLIFGKFAVQFVTNNSFGNYWGLMIFGVLTEGGNLIIGALTIHTTLKGGTEKIMIASLVGLITLVAVFIPLLILNQINVISIGVPLILAQIAVATYMITGCQK